MSGLLTTKGRLGQLLERGLHWGEEKPVSGPTLCAMETQRESGSSMDRKTCRRVQEAFILLLT